jgi:hypothetical protein
MDENDGLISVESIDYLQMRTGFKEHHSSP